MSNPDPVPCFYRLCFATLEPIVGLTGLFLNHVNYIYLLQSFYPPYDDFSSVTAETRLLLDATTGPRMQNLLLPLVLSRARPNDLGLWKIWQGSLLVKDLFLMVALIQTLDGVGLLTAPWVWRWDQLTNVVIMVWFIVMRSAFLLGVGFEGKGGKSEKRG